MIKHWQTKKIWDCRLGFYFCKIIYLSTKPKMFESVEFDDLHSMGKVKSHAVVITNADKSLYDYSLICCQDWASRVWANQDFATYHLQCSISNHPMDQLQQNCYEIPENRVAKKSKYYDRLNLMFFVQSLYWTENNLWFAKRKVSEALSWR